ncbi:MAG: MFS transporter [Blastocatellia bacterium]|nr:MFS transporter [Blastocatellia bacterium]
MSRTKAFSAIYTSVAISYLGVGLVAPLIAIVLSEHGADSFMVGLVGTTMFAAFTLASFPIGTAIDRLGAKPLLVAGLAVYGVSILLFAFIQDIKLFFIMRAIEGIGAAAISVATETMISQLSAPHERARRMSYYALSVGIGWAAGPLAGTLLFNVAVSLPFAACFAFSLIAALMVAVFVPKTDSTSHNPESDAKGLFSKILVPVSAGALYGYLMSSLITLFPLYLKAIGIEETEMGAIITAVIVGTLISQVPIGWAADRVGKRKTLLVCSIILAGVFALLPFHSDWRPFIVTGALIGALAGTLYPVGLSIIGGTVSKERLGAATSLFSLAFGVGSLTGPSVSGLAMDRLGHAWLFYLPSILTACFCLELIVLYGRSAPRDKAIPRQSSL